MSIVGPIAPYNNVQINAQYYNPSRFVISAISFGQTTTVTTTVDMNYVIGQLVRLIIPPEYGCRQLNGIEGYVISLPASDQVEIEIVSTGGDPFVDANQPTKAQIIPVGTINNGGINPDINNQYIYVPGSFINVSP